jgi:hypothetical protein
MLRLRRPFLLAGLILTGLALGCSPESQSMKNGGRASGRSEAARPIPINPRNTNKVMQPEPEGPSAPPLRK